MFFPVFESDQDGLSRLGNLPNEKQRRELRAAKLKRARRIRDAAEKEYIAYKTQEDAEFNAFLWLRKMRDIDDDFFLMLLMVLARSTSAGSTQTAPTPAQKKQHRPIVNVENVLARPM